MQVIVAKDAGFCSGVSKAISLAKSIEGGCYTYGKLIHNENVISDLNKLNIFSIDSLENVKKDKVLILRSHGVGKDVYEYLENHGIEYKDATCPFVKKIHNIVEDYHNKGYKIIIIGDKNHPEVIGTNGWCNYEGIIIDKDTEIKLDPNEKYCLVAQTTYDKKDFENICECIKKSCNLVVKNNTICYTTTSRQEQAELLSKKCDLMLVIGSKISSNTTKLFNICKRNCANTYLIETITDLNSVVVNKKNIKITGVVAGASTPQELIMEVKTQMEENNTKGTFEELLKNYSGKNATQIKAGRVYDCTVISATEGGINVSFSGKKDGFIDKSEAEVDGVTYDPTKYVAGQVIRAKMIEKSAKADSGCIYFSKKAIDQADKDLEASKELLAQPEFKAVVTEVKKQGLLAKVGPFEVFVPASQIRLGYVKEEDLAKYVGKTLRLRAIKSKKDESEGPIEFKVKKTVYASQRVILEEEKATKEKEKWEFFEVGKIVNGKVVRIKDFGAFVKVNGYECLAHISNLSYKKNAKTEEIVEVGKTYEFVILSVDQEKDKIALGYKQLQKSLYEQAFEKYPVGADITGTVTKIEPYGAYVLIEDGVDGLVPISEISRSYVKNPADFLKEGDEVQAKVTKFDVQKSQITLSIKALLPEEVSTQVNVSEDDVKEASQKRAQRNMKKFEQSSATQAPRKRKFNKEPEEDMTVGVSTATSEGSTSSLSIGDLIKNSGFFDEND